jgi:hypothetical protein
MHFASRGNPVQIRSCTRSCKLLNVFATHATFPNTRDGKAAKMEQARRPASSSYNIQSFREKKLGVTKFIVFQVISAVLRIVIF